MNRKRLLDDWNRFWFSATESPSFLWFGRLLALAMLLHWLQVWPHATELFTPEGFHTEDVSWALMSPAVCELWMMIVCLCLGCVLLGPAAKVASAFVALSLFYWILLDPASVGAQIKLAFWGFVLIAACPGALAKTIWPVRMIQLALVGMYFLAGWRKAVFGGWLENPDTLWSQLDVFFRTDLTGWALWAFPWWLWVLAQYGVLVFELGAPAWFYHPQTRSWALLCGLCFHLLIAVFMQGLGYFSLIMLSFYAAFLPDPLFPRFLPGLQQFKGKLRPAS